LFNGFGFALKEHGRNVAPTDMTRDESSPVAKVVVPREAVLVVDDERPLLEVFSEALGTRFDVTTATSAREAEFILRKKEFKVVVADHLMPGGNGMSFLVRAREEYPLMQRILVTGYMKPEMLLRSVNEAALFRYLLKPVSMRELVTVVSDAAKLHDAMQKVSNEDAP
jgi:DNA-binding NtrC family response regulator